MLKTAVVLWALALGLSGAGFVALVLVQAVAGRLRPRGRLVQAVTATRAMPVAIPVSVSATRMDKPRQVVEPLAG